MIRVVYRQPLQTKKILEPMKSRSRMDDEAGGGKMVMVMMTEGRLKVWVPFSSYRKCRPEQQYSFIHLFSF